MPYLSVIITAYNRKQFLLDAIKSALNQTLNRTEYEILIAKNFKDDNIDNYLYKNGMKNITIFKSINNGYIAEAVKQSSGEIISFLDDDDLFLPSKLENIQRIFNKYENLGYLKNATYGFLNDKLPTQIPEKRNYQDIYIRHEEKKKVFNYIMKLQPDGNSSSINIRKEILTNNIDFLYKVDTALDSLYFYLALISKFDMHISSKILTLRRHHQYNLSAIQDQSIDNWISHRIKFLNSYINSLSIIRNEIVYEQPYLEYLDQIISLNRIYLAILPNSNVKLKIRDYLHWYKVYRRNPKGILASLLTLAPNFLKRLYIERSYRKIINSNKNSIYF